MSTTPRKSTSAKSGSSKGDPSVPALKLTEMLAREGAPWRPFEDKGVLLKPLKTPRSAAGIFAACEKQLLSHLKAVCLWPQQDRNQNWRVGDYSYYILEFTPKPKTIVYVQFWSQPDDDDGVLFEVSSGAMNPPADKFVDTERQERLRDHGFEIAGNAGNFRKAIKIENAREVRAAAREAIALLTKVLGYDGTLELRYDLSLQTQMTVRHVFSKVSRLSSLSCCRSGVSRPNSNHARRVSRRRSTAVRRRGRSACCCWTRNGKAPIPTRPWHCGLFTHCHRVMTMMTLLCASASPTR